MYFRFWSYLNMKREHLLPVLLLFLSISLKSQTINYEFIKSIVVQPDSSAIGFLEATGYTQNKDGDFRFIVDNKIKGFISYAKANPNIGQNQTYWAFQARGKKVYAPIFKQIKKDGAVK